MRIIWTTHAKQKLGERHRENTAAKAEEIRMAFATGAVEWIVPGEAAIAAGERLIVRPADDGGWCVITYLGSHPYPDGTDFSRVRRWEKHQRQREMHKSPLNRRRMKGASG
ncbi:MAG TPA: hypothetical protein GX517_12380 [Alicyclobacillus sp.]|nr:hypothetical protein [Alicyclobacillus sp.]